MTAPGSRRAGFSAASRSVSMRREAGSLPPILYDDGHLLILDKPAGLPCYANGTDAASVDRLFPLLSRRRRGPWLAHRLDQDTAGCLLIALRREALLAAQAAFAERQVVKTYWAVLRGRPGADSGVIDIALSKQNDRTGWRMMADERGLPAVTHWRVLGSAGGYTAVELRPATGRTHQLRVHARLLGHPIVGDAVYGQPDACGLQLLSRSLTLGPGSAVAATAEVPAHMRALVSACGVNPAETTAETTPSPASSAV